MNRLEHGRISGQQFVALLLISRLSPVVLMCSSYALVRTASTAWVAEIAGCLLSLPFILLLTWLGKRHPQQTMVQYARGLLGRLAGSLLAVLYLFFIIVTAAAETRSLYETVSAAMTPEVPVTVIAVLLIILAANSARNGIELNGRISEGLSVMTIVVLVFLGFCAYNLMDPAELKPLYFPHGPAELIPPVTSIMTYYAEWLIIGMLLPYMRRPPEAMRCTLIALSCSFALMFFSSLCLIMVFGSQINSISLPAYTLVRQVALDHYFERVESMVSIIWYFVAGAKVALFIWAAAVGVAQLLELKDFRPLVYPVGALIAVLSILAFQGLVDLIRFLAKPFMLYTLSLWFLSTLTLAGTSILKNKTPNSCKGGNM